MWFFTNLIPIYGVWLLDWDLKLTWIAYSLETAVLAIFSVGRMLSLDRNIVAKGIVTLAFLMLFSLLYYFSISSILITLWQASNLENRSAADWEILYFSGLYGTSICLMLLVLIIRYTIDLINENISGNYKHTSFTMLFMDPLIRVMIQTFFFGAGFLMLGITNNILMSIIASVCIKMFMEYRANKDKVKVFQQERWEKSQKQAKIDRFKKKTSFQNH